MTLVRERQRKKRYKINFPEQLLECEVNYRRLLRLLQNLRSLPLEHSQHYIVGHHHNETIIHLSIVDQTKYTSVVHIMQFCPLQRHQACDKTSSNGSRQLPEDLAKQFPNHYLIYQGDVRLYHDACMAEVVKCQRYRHIAPRYEYPNINMHQVDEKAQINHFLGELLSHCLKYGRVPEPLLDQILLAQTKK